VNLGQRDVMKVERDMSNRARGLFARLRASLHPRPVSDDVLEERVRSAIGRACSHAGAVEVSALHGAVRLRGPVLEREHDRLVRAVGRVSGVGEVDDELERHVHPDKVPGLQEAGRQSPGSEIRVSLCADVMKRAVQTVRERDTIEQAVEKMTLANVGFLPVCDEERRVVGVLTDRDVVVRVVAKGLSASTCLVGEVMTRGVVTCEPDDELTLAEQFMAQSQVSRLVVVEDGRLLRGVISLSDIAERAPRRHAARTLRAVAAREAPRE
jgi:CBS domain-containing protein